ncbi:myelin-oligodendrocyte glycoprotein-like isoform X2 [Alligator sinensis]|uniref:Myelin-oligodendrocyte glycoprotein-like isoform X2 n=1 Tax=Alligator sinensis TaxID=38654 RepID=A0A1U8DPY4_ALLSI|nr:myelin-oligodendrocyte glycoprotein-like isoform X2 [Alligator sinensis]
MCAASPVLCLLLGTAAGSAPIPSTGPGCRREFISITAPVHHGVLLPFVVPDAAVDPLGATLNWQTEAVHLHSPEVMHAYRDGKDDLESQAKRFRGRTEVFPEEIDNGNASLLLKNITQNDTGTYHGYFFPSYNSPCTALIVQLNVSDVTEQENTKTEGAWTVAVTVIFILTICGVAFYYRKWKSRKKKNQKSVCAAVKESRDFPNLLLAFNNSSFGRDSRVASGLL